MEAPILRKVNYKAFIPQSSATQVPYLIRETKKAITHYT